MGGAERRRGIRGREGGDVTGPRAGKQSRHHRNADAAADVAQEVDIYNLVKFQRSNQNACINQRPIVRRGDRVAIYLPLVPELAIAMLACARIGAVTGKGLAAVIKQHYNKTLLFGAVILVCIANTINIGADIGAMAAACKLLVGGTTQVYAVLIASFCAACEIYLAYRRYVVILKWLTLSLFAYVALLFVVELPLREVLSGVLVPRTALTPGALTALVAPDGPLAGMYAQDAGRYVAFAGGLHRSYGDKACEEKAKY